MAWASPARVGQVRAVEQLALQRGEEGLGDGVVQRVADGAHRAEQAGVAEALSEHPGRVLAAVIGMGDGAVGATPQAGHLEGVDDELGAEVVGDRPADDPSGPGVDDDGEVDPALAGAVLGDVLHPQPVRAVGAELAVHQIVRQRIRPAPAGAADACGAG